MKQREHRTRVVLPVRIRWDDRWAAATICNISPRGLMVRSASLPPRGAYVEVELPSATITARAVWVRGAHCGLRAREKLNVDAFVSPRRGRTAATPKASPPPPAARPAAAGLFAASQRFSVALQFASMAAAGAIVAAAIGWEMYKTLGAPAAAIAASMAGE